MGKMKFDLFKITALTNMHVGSGDISFGVIDNLVQKDVITELPTIHSSSLKGALREFFEQTVAESTELVKFVFGADPKSSGGSTDGSGNYRFFSAHLLSIPVRSNQRPFFRAISPAIVGEFCENITEVGAEFTYKDKIEALRKLQPKKDSPMIFQDLGNVVIEDFDAEFNNPDGLDMEAIKDVFGDNIVLFHDDVLKEICSELPVIARNNLENGQSKNLWYEEIVPRQTMFYFLMARPEDGSEDYYNRFLDSITKNIIQIGANATIGYGYTKIQKMS